MISCLVTSIIGSSVTGRSVSRQRLSSSSSQHKRRNIDQKTTCERNNTKGSFCKLRAEKKVKTEVRDTEAKNNFSCFYFWRFLSADFGPWEPQVVIDFFSFEAISWFKERNLWNKMLLMWDVKLDDGHRNESQLLNILCHTFSVFLALSSS